MAFLQSRTALVSGVLILCAAVTVAGDASEAEPLPAEFTLVALDGEQIRFADLRGKVVLLDFWFSACPPCRKALPQLRRIAKNYDDDSFVLIGVSVDKDLAKLESFVEKEGMDWPHVWDPGHDVAQAFNVTVFPSYLLLDYEGRPVRFAKGWNRRTEQWLSGAVKTQIKRLKKARKAGHIGS